MFERFDKDARRAVVHAATEEAKGLGSSTIEAEHLLLALSAGEPNPTADLLVECGLDHGALLAALERETEHSLAAVGVALSDFALPQARTPARRSPKLGASSKRALERAAHVAIAGEDRQITAPHLLIGILRAGIGTVPRALAGAEIDRVALLSRAERLLG